MTKEYFACEFCAGAGGLSEGLKQAGLNVAVANEINSSAAMTYKYNHPKTVMIEKDMRDVRAREIIDVSSGEIFLVAAGLPCQGFSMAGERNINDPRNKLFRQFIRIVNRLEPKIILIENVVGLLSFNKGRTIDEIKKMIENLNYFPSTRVLNAIDFGVPQSRKRLFIIGSPNERVDINLMKIKKIGRVTIREAISDLDFLDAGESSHYYLKKPQSDYQIIMRKNSTILFNHEAPKHSIKIINRFSKLKPGQTMLDIPKHFRTKKIVTYRLKASEPARTITTLPDDFIHYKRNRILTVREMARLQGFPDSYKFLGPKSTGGKRRRYECPQYSQVGNAVSPLLAKALGQWLIKS